jgi:phage tail sheath protein FI
MAFDTPGVYINYKTDGPLVVRAASTSTAVFIGPTVIGSSVSGSVVTPTFVSSLTEYAKVFATEGARAGVVCMPTTSNTTLDTMGHAVRGFFMNGGQNAYIVSTSTGTSATASGSLSVTGSATVIYLATAKSQGIWGNDVQITLSDSPIGANFLDVRIELAFTGDDGAETLVETFIGVAADQLGQIASNIVDITVPDTPPAGPHIATLDVSGAPDGTSAGGNLAGGLNSNTGAEADMGTIFNGLRDIDDISIIVMPDRIWPAAQADYALALAHCQYMKDRITLIQLEDGTTDFSTVSVPLDKFAAVYYPRARVALPVAGGATKTDTVNTTGHVAGVIARTDGQKGAWTAPAGMRASVSGVTELTVEVSHSFQARMNPENINAIRHIQGIPVIWGARTRDKGGIYEYIPVMRTAILIADSLRDALGRVVFAKNTETLWANVKAGTNGFMDGLFTQGAFQGATPGQAYRVAVGLGESMSQDDIRAGVLKLNVAFAPAFVAEFIEVNIEQIFEPG